MSKISRIGELALERQKVIQKVNEGELEVIDTGFEALNKRTGGFRAGDFIVIGARPAMGKTTFAQNLAYNVATRNGKGKGVLFFSMEMANNEIVDRMISDTSGVDNWKIRRGVHLEAEELKNIDKAVVNFETLSFYIDDTTHMTVADFKSRVREMVDECDVNVVFVDHLSLLLPYNKECADYETKLDEATQTLRDLAREFKLVLVLMVELPRLICDNCETGEFSEYEFRPNLLSLKPFGSLAQDASTVMFLHRPDYYRLNEEDYTPSNVTELVVAKNAHGGGGVVKLAFDFDALRFTQFSDKETI